MKVPAHVRSKLGRLYRSGRGVGIGMLAPIVARQKRKDRMKPFQAIHGDLRSIASNADVYDRVAATFANPMLIRAWSFDRTDEERSARSIAAERPDALLPVVPACQHLFRTVRRFPKDMDADLGRMKRCVADELATLFPQKPVNAAPIRAVIMVPWLPNNANNNILRVVAGYLAGLHRRQDVEAAVLLITNENAVETGSPIAESRHDARAFRATHAAVVEEFGAPASSLMYAPPPLVDEGNVAWHRAFVDSFRPNVVFVPNVEMTSAYIHAFGKSCATVFLQTSLRNRPPYDFDRYLYLGERRAIDATHIHPELWHYHSFGYERFGEGSGLSRRDIGLTDGDVVLVTAGNRLEVEVDAEIAAIVARVMAAQANVKWLLLGVRDESKVRANLGESFAGLQDRVICKGYVKDIGDHLALSDIYVNPRRTGGAVSMALSVYGGTPVISFAGNDAGNFLIDDMICETAEQYAERLMRLAADKAHLADVDVRQRARFDSGHTIEASAADLVEHLKAALAAKAGA